MPDTTTDGIRAFELHSDRFRAYVVKVEEMARANQDRDRPTAEEVEAMTVVLDALDAVIALHSPPDGWEQEWSDPEWALANGEVRCAGCQTHVTSTPLRACPTRKAIEEVSRG